MPVLTATEQTRFLNRVDSVSCAELMLIKTHICNEYAEKAQEIRSNLARGVEEEEEEGNCHSGGVWHDYYRTHFYYSLLQRDRAQALVVYKDLKDFANDEIDNIVMGGVPAKVINEDGSSGTGEGAMVEICNVLKDTLTDCKCEIEVTLRLDMALQKFGLSFWK
jgi:hypothetical protein